MKKKIWIGGIVVLLILVYGVLLLALQELRFEIADAAKLTVFSGSNGQTVEVTDQGVIETITQHFNRLSFQKGKSSRDYEGCAYVLTWYDSQGAPIESITVMGEDRISYRNRFCQIEPGTEQICLSYMEELYS